jgi:hypothetical protein
MVEKGLFTGVECGQAFQGLLRRFLAYGGEGFFTGIKRGEALQISNSLESWSSVFQI